VLRLCFVKNWAKAQGENWVILSRQKEAQETQCSLFPIYCRIPKLDVAGSLALACWGDPMTSLLLPVAKPPSPSQRPGGLSVKLEAIRIWLISWRMPV
jgi:hypothetical protein